MLRCHDRRQDFTSDRGRGAAAPQRARRPQGLGPLSDRQHRAGGADHGFDDFADHLRASIGAPFADAALAAAESSVPSFDPAPAAVRQVWAFEPKGPSDAVLISSARLWGSDLFVEALRVEDDDAPVPVEPVRERFARWVAVAGIGPALKTMRIPGRDGSYVIFAAGAPARRPATARTTSCRVRGVGRLAGVPNLAFFARKDQPAPAGSNAPPAGRSGASNSEWGEERGTSRRDLAATHRNALNSLVSPVGFEPTTPRLKVR